MEENAIHISELGTRGFTWDYSKVEVGKTYFFRLKDLYSSIMPIFADRLMEIVENNNLTVISWENSCLKDTRYFLQLRLKEN